MLFCGTLCASAFGQYNAPDPARRMDGTRTTPEAAPAPATDIQIGAPLRTEPRKPPPLRPKSADPEPQPAEVAGASGPFSEKELLGLVSGILGKDVTPEQLRDMRSIALAIVACFRSPACAQFAKQMAAASGITDELKGGIAAAKPKPPPEPRFKVAGFRYTGVTAVQEKALNDLLQGYTGLEITVDEMKDAAALVEELYRKEGYFVARAYVPQQTSKDGIIEIAVLEGRLGEVKLETAGESRLKPGVAEGILSRAKSGDLVEDSTVERALLLLSDLPGQRVRSTLAPGAQVGAADLQVVVEDTGERVTGAIEGDNFGAKFSGKDRLSLSANLINPSGYGDMLSMRVMRTFGEENTTLGRAAYTLPVGSYGTRVGASVARTTYAVGGAFSELDSSGYATIASVYAQHPIIRTRNFNLYAFAGYDHKKLQDRFDAIDVDNPRRSNVVSVGLSGDRRDNFGFLPGEGAVNSFALTVTRGDLKFDNQNQMTADQAATGQHTAGKFWKYNASVSRLQGLVPDWSLLVSANAQMASKNLDPSEQMQLGGPWAVRAYPTGELPSDQAVIASAELRYAWRTDYLPGEITAFGFYDHGWSELNREPRPADRPNSRNVSAYGGGLSWNKSNDFSFRLTVAMRPSSSPRPTADTSNTNSLRAWFQAVKWF
jgi:hemolysin activation/secretion protein